MLVQECTSVLISLVAPRQFETERNLEFEVLMFYLGVKRFILRLTLS